MLNNRVNKTKEKIINSTIDLLLTKDISLITIKDISDKASVGIGLINYHFQTKENLINIAIKNFIAKEIGNEVINNKINEMSAKEKLLFSLEGYANFLASFPNIMKVHLINSFSENYDGEDLDISIKYYSPILEAIFPHKTYSDRIIILQQMVSVIMHTFLNASQIEKHTSINFYDESQRNLLIRNLVNNLSI